MLKADNRQGQEGKWRDNGIHYSAFYPIFGLYPMKYELTSAHQK